MILKRTRKSLTLKWMVFSILLATIPLAIAGFSIIQIYQKDLKKSVIGIEEMKASMVVERTEAFFEKITSNLFTLVNDEDFKIRHSSSHVKNLLESLLYQNDYIWELALLDKRGKEVMKVSKYRVIGPDDLESQAKSEMFRAASKGKTYYGDFYLTKDIVPTMEIAVPVDEYKREPVGVLSVKIHLRYLWNLVPQIQIGKEGFTYVVDKEGNLIAHPDMRRVLLGLNVRSLPVVDQVVSGKEGHLEFDHPEGERVLCAYKLIKKLGWGVIVQVPVKEAYAPLRKVAHTAFIWILIGLATAVILSLFLAKKFTLPIKRLSNGMGEIAKGNLDTYIQPTTKDEMGLLAESFNQMTQNLKQSQESLKEAEKKYRNIFEKSKDMVFITSVSGEFVDFNQAGIDILGYENKEELFNITPKDTYFNPVEQEKIKNEITQKGFVKDFEVKLKKKDGTPIDTLITANMRKDEEGRILGYEGIIKDISGRKRIEEEVLKRNEELQTLYDLSFLINQSLDLDKVLPIALDKATKLTGFEMGVIYFFNEHEKILELKHSKGYSQKLVESVKILRFGEGVSGKVIELKKPIMVTIDEYSSPRMRPSLEEEGIQSLVGIPLLSKGKTIGAITLLSHSVHTLNQREINLLQSIGTQIGLTLENARLFSEVVKGKNEWETTFDAVTDLITIRDKDYRIIRANKSAFKRYGLKPEEMIGKKCFEALHQSDRPCEGCYVSKTLKTKQPVSGERDSKYLRGIFQYFTFPIYDETGEVIAVVDLAREVTEEKRFEIEKEVINNINKILASSLDVRQAMKAVHSELKKVLGSERMTVALLEEGRKKFRFFTVERDDDRKELFGSVICRTEGTTLEKVVDTGLPVVVSETSESDSWLHQKLLKEGIRSTLVFPLEYKGVIIGSLNLGSHEPAHFSEKHVNFLYQVSAGLAISIQNALLFEEIKNRLDELTVLYEITKVSVSPSLAPDQMLTEIINSLNNFFKFEYFGIILVEKNTKRLIPHTSYKGHLRDDLEKLELCVGKGITGWVAEKGESLLVNDVRKDSRYISFDDEILSEICVPLKAGQQIIGVLDAQSKALDAFSEDDLRLLNIVGGQLATLIENIHLQEEINQSEEKYRTVVEGALEGVGIVADDYRHKYVNKKFAEIAGYPRDELIGMDFRNILDEESKALIADRDVRWQRGEELSPLFEVKVVRKDGDIRNVEIRAKGIRDSKEERNIIAFFNDITEKKKMEEQLLQAEKLRAVGEMASGVAHDFNNALAAILGNTQLLLYTTHDEELKETLKIIEKVAKDSGQTVRRLQDFTRKRVDQELFKVDVNSVIKDSMEMTKPKWKDEPQSRGIRIEMVSNLEEIPSVSGNGSELREVITNMIFNAIEAMPEGGKIEIRTFKKRRDVFIQISDSGIGIAEEAERKIFEPFFTTKPFTNTGLGLSMSYGIIKRFGGEIEVESKAGQGTTFTIILPIGGEEKEEAVSLQPIKKGREARILVIDDDEFVRNVLSRTLVQANHQVTLAENGEKGVQFFKEGKFDIVLTDLGMPGMSGWEVCRIIKEISPHTPVGMITGWGVEKNQNEVEECGLDFFISKPFDFNQILNVVSETMASKEE